MLGFFHCHYYQHYYWAGNNILHIENDHLGRGDVIKSRYKKLLNDRAHLNEKFK